MYIIEEEEQKAIRANGFVYCAICGPPKIGKTRLACACVEHEAFDKLAYVCCDPKAEGLQAVLLEHRDKVTPIVPGLQPATEQEIKNKDKALQWNPFTEKFMKRTSYSEDMLRICTYDWAKDGYKALVIDTMSEASERILLEVAAKGFGSGDKESQYGQQRHSLDFRTTAPDLDFKDRWLASPNQPDYGLAQKWVENKLLVPLAKQMCHVITTWHVDIDTKTGFAGPMSAGKALIPKIPKYFDLFLGMGTEKNPKNPQKPRHFVYTKPWKLGGVFEVPAGIRDGHTTEIFNQEKELLEENPAHFWAKVLEVTQEQMEQASGEKA
jgi:hypothetical protein